MTPMPLGLFVKKLQSKGGYDILFTYFVVEAKSKIGSRLLGVTSRGLPLRLSFKSLHHKI